jgi:SH3 domain-containing protein
MNPPRRRRRSALPVLLLSVSLALSAASCLTSPTLHHKKEPDPAKQAISERDATIHQLQQKADHQSARLAEQDALIKQLEESLLSQQKMLDDAIQEVVRVKAKQRSMESRAEAASEMAEAEIAMKSLRDQAGDSNPPELANAEQLMARGTREFEAQNFGGALYLVGQAKTQIKLGLLRTRARKETGNGEDEMPFAVPLPLKLSAKGNLREGPGPEFKVIATLEGGTAVTGYFTKGPWLRVDGPGGKSGWIHRSLVTPN